MKMIPIQIQNCITQLDEYFKGERKDFTIRINPAGTEFQGKVWNSLLKIPYGKTISYLEQAKQFGDEKAIRAIASANGKNPIPIIIPCHRVIGNNGSLTGYAGGILKKQWLLEHEGALQQKTLFH
jgi:methylated-DNA-[protein]-cysteine S-methyltransferase